jgi:hypothetical protein
MFQNRRNRLISVLFALISLLFMQWAVAGYACPSTGSNATELTAVTEASMPCAATMPMTMDDAQPNLCQAHCQVSQQSADTYQTAFPPAIDTLPANLTVQVALSFPPQVPLQLPHLQRTTAPPLAIRNCCFRL